MPGSAGRTCQYSPADERSNNVSKRNMAWLAVVVAVGLLGWLAFRNRGGADRGGRRARRQRGRGTTCARESVGRRSEEVDGSHRTDVVEPSATVTVPSGGLSHRRRRAIGRTAGDEKVLHRPERSIERSPALQIEHPSHPLRDPGERTAPGAVASHLPARRPACTSAVAQPEQPTRRLLRRIDLGGVQFGSA